MKIFIYGLVDPKTKQVRYIGKTNNLKERYRHHFSKLQTKTHKNHWIKSLLRIGIKPEIIVLEETNEHNWQSREIALIAEYRKRGYKLTNGTDGGEGWIPSAKMRKAHSEYMKKWWSTVKDRSFTREHKENLRKAQPHAKKILQLSMDGKRIKQWDTITLASMVLKIDRVNIRKNCQNKRPTAGGFVFKYV